MKNPKLLPISLIIFLFATSCGRSNYSAADETTGLVNVTKHWSGYSSGYAIIDTLLPGAIDSIKWADYYYHTITDSTFSVQKINDLEIGVQGMPLRYVSTNATTHLELFDSTISGASPSYLDFWTITDSAYYEYHWIGTYNTPSGHYVLTDIYLHTH